MPKKLKWLSDWKHKEWLYEKLTRKNGIDPISADFLSHGIDIKFRTPKEVKNFIRLLPKMLNWAIKFSWKRMEKLGSKGKIDGYDGFITYSSKWLELKTLKAELDRMDKDVLYDELYNFLMSRNKRNRPKIHKAMNEPDYPVINREMELKRHHENINLRNFNLRSRMI